jgi:hypothetical protein
MQHKELKKKRRINKKGEEKKERKRKEKERKKQKTHKLRSNLINSSKAANGRKQLLARHDIKYIFFYSLLATVSSGVKRLGREANYSPPSSAEVKNGEVVPPLTSMSTWHGV